MSAKVGGHGMQKAARGPSAHLVPLAMQIVEASECARRDLAQDHLTERAAASELGCK